MGDADGIHPSSPGERRPPTRTALALLILCLVAGSPWVALRLVDKVAGDWLARLRVPEVIPPGPDGSDSQTNKAPVQTQPDISPTPTNEILPRLTLVVPGLQSPGPTPVQTNDPPTQSQEAAVRRIQPVDCVLVIDMLRSMNPFVTDTPRIVRNFLEGPAPGSEALVPSEWGLWGFRGNKASGPIGFTATNFTPVLAKPEEFTSILFDELVSTTLGEEWEDGAFLGMAGAVRQTAWRTGSRRNAILIGDSSSYDARDPRNTLGSDEFALREEATRAQVRVFAIFIGLPKAAADHRRARGQFQQLADNRRLGFGVDYLEVVPQSGDGVSFAEAYESALHKAMEAAVTGQSL